MSTDLRASNAAVASAFQASLLHQGLMVLLVVALVAIAWSFLRSAELKRTRATRSGSAPCTLAQPFAALSPSPEPAARRLLRISFGLLWIFDGMLQVQSSMPLGMVPGVVQPGAAGSPAWVLHLVSIGTTTWSYHPVPVATATVWVQLGIGFWLLVAPRGDWSRLAGVASAGWGAVVWVFGESFGGIFAPGLSWLTGAPGAVVFYCIAGILVALPEPAWASARLGRGVLRAMGAFYCGMAVLQAWPGRGYWQGQPRPGSVAGTLTGMVQQMARTPQPPVLASVVAAFGRFDAAHGWGVNLFVVVALGVTGAALGSARDLPARLAVVATVVLNLAAWLLVQDLGFLGGVGTDPNTMVPMALVVLAGYVAIAKLPPGRPATGYAAATPDGELTTRGGTGLAVLAQATAGPAQPGLAEVAGSPGTYTSTEVAADAPAPAGSLWVRITARPIYTFRAIAALGAITVVFIGAVPMAAAALSPRAGPLLAQAVDGAPQAVDSPAPGFSLVNQHGEPVSLASLKGRTVVLTFLDDTCTTDCPVIAQELRTADTYLGRQARQVEMVAVNANPRFTAPEYLAAFDRQEGLDGVANWLYLTGSLPQLKRVWRAYGEAVVSLPGGSMIGHSDFAYLIDASGRTRYVLGTDPGPSTRATESSFAVMLADTLKSLLGKA